MADKEIGHLCGRTDCPGDDTHRHPYFVQSVFPHIEAKPSADPNPYIVRDAGRHRYSTWTGDNNVFVEFADGKKALFPGAWLRERAKEGDETLMGIFERHRRERETADSEVRRQAAAVIDTAMSILSLHTPDRNWRRELADAARYLGEI